MKFAQIALRNLSRQKRRSLLLAAAIAFGIFIVTLVNGFSAGTVRVLKENMADIIGGHVFITVETKTGDRTVSMITDDSKLMEALKPYGIKPEQVAKTTDIQGRMIFGSNSTTQIVIGAEWRKDADFSKKMMISPSDMEAIVAQDNGIVISKATADKLKVAIGDSLDLKCKTVTGQENVGTFVVSYITQDTSMIGGMIAVANGEYVKQLANLPSRDAYLTLRIKLDSLDLAPAFAEQLKQSIVAQGLVLAPKEEMTMAMDVNVFKMGRSEDFTGQRVDVTTINDMLSEVTTMSAGLSIASLVMLVFLLLITMIGIANTFRMIMYERTREVGTIRALGMHRKEVQRLFLYEAVFLSLLGVLLGIALAGIAMVVLGLVSFGTDSVFAILLNNGHLSFTFDPVSMIISTVLVTVFTWLAALGPARKAARLEPAEALRTNY